MPQHLTHVGADGLLPRIGLPLAIPSAANVLGKRRFFHPPVDSRLFEGFQGGGLSMRQTGLDSTLRESPAPAAAGLYQQEFDAVSTEPVADRRNLLALTQPAQLRKPNESGG